MQTRQLTLHKRSQVVDITSCSRNNMHAIARLRHSSSASSGAILLVSTLLLVFSSSFIDATDSGTFFLKAAKNVPRIGRRSGGGDTTFFLKTSKNVPRIGRRGSPWGSSLTEMRENGGWPWFRNSENVLPNRIARTGPTSLTGLWDGPLRRPHFSLPPQHSQPEGPIGYWHSSEQEGEGLVHYDADEDEDVSASQLLAPPPPADFPRLPQENSFSRQRRDELHR